jgi:hypothetical protein
MVRVALTLAGAVVLAVDCVGIGNEMVPFSAVEPSPGCVGEVKDPPSPLCVAGTFVMLVALTDSESPAAVWVGPLRLVTVAFGSDEKAVVAFCGGAG